MSIPHSASAPVLIRSSPLKPLKTHDSTESLVFAARGQPLGLLYAYNDQTSVEAEEQAAKKKRGKGKRLLDSLLNAAAETLSSTRTTTPSSPQVVPDDGVFAPTSSPSGTPKLMSSPTLEQNDFAIFEDAADTEAEEQEVMVESPLAGSPTGDASTTQQPPLKILSDKENVAPRIISFTNPFASSPRSLRAPSRRGSVDTAAVSPVKRASATPPVESSTMSASMSLPFAMDEVEEATTSRKHGAVDEAATARTAKRARLLSL